MAAQSTFFQVVPKSWILRPQHPDYGVDFVVQLAPLGQVSGVEFDVQLKGTSTPRYVGGQLAVRIETVHLKHFVFERSRPLAIVGVDTESDKVLWTTATEACAALQATRPRWEEQQTVTLYLDSRRDLRDTASMLEAEILRYHDEVRAATGNGILRFYFDDFCYTIDLKFSAMREFEIVGDIWFPTSSIRYPSDYFEPIVWFGRPSRPISSGAEIRGSARGVFEVGRLFQEGGPRMAVRDIESDPVVSYAGPQAEWDRWIRFRYAFRGRTVTIEAGEHCAEVALHHELLPAPLLVIGARFAPSSAFMTADLRLLELRDTRDNETVARWTFPPVDPLLDVSQQGHDLCLHSSLRWGRRGSTADPSYIPPPGVSLRLPPARSEGIPDPGAGLPADQARAARRDAPGWKLPEDPAERAKEQEERQRNWEAS